MSEEQTLTIGAYLLERLAQAGVTAIFGVPGDCLFLATGNFERAKSDPVTLAFLDLVEDHPTIKWIGCCNELNAAYACDGYARAKQGLGVLCTTFGVGELSAVNGIAGAFSERVPILHIVGTPSTKLQAHRSLLHHTLGDGRFDAYIGVARNVTAAQALLTSTDSNENGQSAASEIDRVIKTAFVKCRPTYLTLPTDCQVAFAKISAQSLKTPITQESVRKEIMAKELPDGLLEHVLNHITDLYKSAKRPIILVDACAIRFGAQDLVRELLEATGLPFFTTPMGKAAIDESHPQFSGTYIGSNTIPEVKELVESADLTISIGGLKSDFNTGSFSYRMRQEQTVDCHSDYCQVQYAKYDDLGFHILLPALIKALGSVKPAGKFAPLKGAGLSPPSTTAQSGNLSQDNFWPMAVAALRETDIVVTETGTSNFGILDTKLPPKAALLSQVLYGSIGWAGGAILGATVAAEELGRHAVLFTGEGSYQLTIQDVSQFMRLGLKPTIFVLNNKGYTIERFIHGPKRHYNDIPDWDWQRTLVGVSRDRRQLNAQEYFGGKKDETSTFSVTTSQEFADLLENPAFKERKTIQFVEVHLPADDAPRALRVQAELSAQANSE